MAIDAPCIFCTRTNRVIDFPRKDETASTALTRLAPTYGDALSILPFEEAWTRQEEAFKTEPAQITAEAFDDALNVLPPVSWVNSGDAESFKISERLIGSITAIYVRIGQRHFTFNDKITLPHRACCDRVLTSKAFREPGQNALGRD